MMQFITIGKWQPDHCHETPIQPERARQHLIEEHGCGDVTYFRISKDEAVENDLEYHDFLHREER